MSTVHEMMSSQTCESPVEYRRRGVRLSSNACRWFRSAWPLHFLRCWRYCQTCCWLFRCSVLYLAFIAYYQISRCKVSFPEWRIRALTSLRFQCS